ncbi:hypothetical protein TNCV_1241621 [Trichonephila clavipes]|nr:hypothetical protein TNCV_1241621 [Trichonephila clavipes]
MIYEVFFHLLQRVLTLVFRNDLPSFFEILILDLLVELFKPYSTYQLLDGSLLETSAAIPMTTVEERIPVVHSFTIWKMCEALDLKAKFVPLPGATALPRTPYRWVD